MTTRDQLIADQREWAATLGYKTDPRGYLEEISQNLRAPLSGRAATAFRRGSGGELNDRPARNGRPGRPAKMKALHSSAVLAVNVFDYWSQRDPAPLGAALGVDHLESIAFEAQHETGLGGIPPNLDVELRLRDGSLVGVESKFTEWFHPKRSKTDPFKAKYFPSAARIWQCRNLGNCQLLAEALQGRAHAYRYLNAPQLLKHALGLGTTAPGRFCLLYLYYEGRGTAADTHRGEIADFTRRLEAEIPFRALSYQELFGRLERAVGAAHGDYLTYLRTRYFTP